MDKLYKQYYFIILLFCLFSVHYIFSENSLKENLFIETKNNEYSIEFYIQLFNFNEDNSLKLIDYLYNFNNLKQIVENQKIRCTLIKENGMEQDLNYDYKYLFFNAYYRYLRMKEIENNRIYFFLTDYRQNLKYLPQLIDSNGFYKIEKNREDYFLHYYQTCRLNKKINQVYIYMIKQESILFKDKLSRFIKTLYFQDKVNASH